MLQLIPTPAVVVSVPAMTRCIGRQHSASLPEFIGSVFYPASMLFPTVSNCVLSG